MKFQVTFLPDWAVVRRLLAWWQPGLELRANIFGQASANKRYLHGAVDVTTTVERLD